MNVLVTGSNGFLGAALVRTLLERESETVSCLVRPGSSIARLTGLSSERARIVRGELSSKAEAARLLEGVGTIYHLAAAMSGAPSDMYLDTVVASKHLLEAVGELTNPPRLVLVSSFSVYGVADLPAGAVVDESTPLETRPEARDVYAQTKLRQERLFREYQERAGFELVVLRPGVIYGPTGGVLSGRVGLQFPGVFLHLGNQNLVPLSYVENCADAVALAGSAKEAAGEVYNVHDDDLPRAGEYLREYEREVKPLCSVPVPYPLLLVGSHLIERYHRYSRGQLPAVFTPYKTKSLWKRQRYTNQKLKGLGWTQPVPTEEALRRTFEAARARAA